MTKHPVDIMMTEIFGIPTDRVHSPEYAVLRTSCKAAVLGITYGGDLNVLQSVDRLHRPNDSFLRQSEGRDVQPEEIDWVQVPADPEACPVEDGDPRMPLVNVEQEEEEVNWTAHDTADKVLQEYFDQTGGGTFSDLNSFYEVYAVFTEHLDNFWQEVKNPVISNQCVRRHLLAIAATSMQAFIELTEEPYDN